jgi:hypothetical protein
MTKWFADSFPNRRDDDSIDRSQNCLAFGERAFDEIESGAATEPD